MRKYISTKEWTLFFSAIKGGTTECRDRAMFKMAYDHGLRVSEIKNLTINDLDLEGKTIYIRRLKNGLSTIHPLQPSTHKLIVKWLRQRAKYIKTSSDNNTLFLSTKGTSLSRQWIYRLTKNYGKKAGLPVEIHPHMLRHACGYALADQGLDTRLIQDYLGHRNIHHTVRYTASNVARFSKVWKKQ